MLYILPSQRPEQTTELPARRAGLMAVIHPEESMVGEPIGN
jgi:hypothetical protein